MGKLSLGGEGWDLGLGCPTKVCACLSLCQWPLLVTETGVIWIRGCLSATMSCLDDVSIHNCETSSNARPKKKKKTNLPITELILTT